LAATVAAAARRANGTSSQPRWTLAARADILVREARNVFENHQVLRFAEQLDERRATPPVRSQLSGSEASIALELKRAHARWRRCASHRP
jgi:hypothetical protein